jgi:hypothetical protein
VATLFLELDDEITSAVARLRAASDPAVALVLPAGSRIASSRINFRLLAREAESLGTQLAIVSPEATARALASAAGLPTFGTVNRYEAAMAGGSVAAGEGAGEPPDALERDASASYTGGGGSAAGGGYGPIGSAAAVGGLAGAEAARGGASRNLPVARGPRRFALPRVRGAPIVAAIVILALLGAGAAAGAYFLLPEAKITVTPRIEAFAPLVFDVTADPEATTSDPANGIVPATWLETTVDAQDTFKATGVKVTETKATGSVTFSWYGNQTSVSIPSGSLVKTSSGIAFKTLRSVVVPKASVGGAPGTASVDIEAVKAGTGGNVGATKITVVPSGFDPVLLKVTNPKATTGGTHTETKVVKKSDYDAAVAALKKVLEQRFADWLTSDPQGTALRLDDTATLDEATLDPAAADVVGKALDSFDLAAHASGRVLTIDPAVVDAAGAARFRTTQVPAGYTLVDSTVTVTHRQVASDDPAKPVFEVTANGQGYRQLDPAALEALVLGKPVDEARAILRPYGDPVVALSPDWFGTIPQLDWRVTVEVAPPAGVS